MALLKDDDLNVRSHTLYALAELGGLSVFTSLAGSLNDPNPQARRAALHGLGKLQGTRAHDLLCCEYVFGKEGA